MLTILALAAVACTETEAPAADLSTTAAASDDRSAEMHEDLSSLVRTWLRDGEWLVSPVLPAAAMRVGVLCDLNADSLNPRFEAQLLKNGQVFAAWQPLSTTFSEGSLRVLVSPFAVRGDAAQLRIRADEVDWLQRLEWTATVPESVATGASGDGFGQQTGGLTTALTGLGIVDRATWKARPTKCTATDKARYRMAIHHTQTPATNPAQRVRAIQAYHMDTHGWCDIGYHFLVATDGTVFEGRPYNLLGAHVGGQNSGNIGISFIGCFHKTGCDAMQPSTPPAAMLEAGAQLLGTLRALEGIELSDKTVKGHRDHAGQSTDCPGDYLYAKVGLLTAIGSKASLTKPLDPGTVEPDPKPVDTKPPATVACAERACGQCTPDAGCGWCASKGVCQDKAGSCAWQGYVGLTTCWPSLWPCTLGSCWNPNKDLAACGQVTVDEDFSSGKYNVHRYWTHLPAGAPVTITLQRKTGSWAPSLLVTDQAGKLIAGGDAGALHPQVKVISAVSGRTGDTAQVVLQASADVQAFLILTSWAVVDAGFVGKVPTDATYHFAMAQGCATPLPTGEPNAAAIGAVYGGLTLQSMELPRAGLTNPTLQSVFGISTEPYGAAGNYAGQAVVRGTISEFGGPNDTGVTATETGAITGEKLRALNDPLNPSAATLAAKPDAYYYIAMRFNYQPQGKAWWKSARILVINPKTGAAVVVRPVDWGPNVATKRVGDLSPQTRKDLGLQTDDEALFAFAKPGAALGVVK